MEKGQGKFGARCYNNVYSRYCLWSMEVLSLVLRFLRLLKSLALRARSVNIPLRGTDNRPALTFHGLASIIMGCPPSARSAQPHKAPVIVAPLPPCYASTQAARFRGVSARVKKRYRFPEKAQGTPCAKRHYFAMH